MSRGAEPGEAAGLIEQIASHLPSSLFDLALSVVPAEPTLERLTALRALVPIAASNRRTGLIDQCIQVWDLLPSDDWRTGWEGEELVSAIEPFLPSTTPPSPALVRLIARAIGHGLSDRETTSTRIKQIIDSWPAESLRDLLEGVDRTLWRVHGSETIDAHLSTVADEQLQSVLPLVIDGRPLAHRAWWLSGLARRLSGAAAVRATEASLTAARELPEAAERLRWLTQTIPLTPDHAASALELAGMVSGEHGNARMWASLLPTLPDDLLEQALSSAERIGDVRDRFVTMARIAVRLPAARRDPLVHRLRSQFDEAERSVLDHGALWVLLPALAPSQRVTVARELLEAMLLGQYRPTAEEFIELVAHLPREADTAVVHATEKLSTRDRIVALTHLQLRLGTLDTAIEEARREADRLAQADLTLSPPESGGIARYLAQLGRDIRQRAARWLLDQSARPANVLLGASAPAAVRPDDGFVARFVACAEHLRESLHARLVEAQPGAHPSIGLQRSTWSIGQSVTVRVCCDELGPPQNKSFEWNGAEAVVEFPIRVPATARPRRIVLEFEVELASCVVATVTHELEVTLGASSEHRQTTTTSTPDRAFASYSSKDKERVYDRVGALRSVSAMDIFIDCLDLRAGEELKPVIEAEIKTRPVFLLFWSRNAKSSSWVTWEWQTALEHKDKVTIRPQPLEPPHEASPPPELKHLNFRDPLNYLRATP